MLYGIRESEITALIDFQTLIARAKILSLISPGNDGTIKNFYQTSAFADLFGFRTNEVFGSIFNARSILRSLKLRPVIRTVMRF
jgi:hypothetical protein